MFSMRRNFYASVRGKLPTVCGNDCGNYGHHLKELIFSIVEFIFFIA